MKIIPVKFDILLEISWRQILWDRYYKFDREVFKWELKISRFEFFLFIRNILFSYSGDQRDALSGFLRVSRALTSNIWHCLHPSFQTFVYFKEKLLKSFWSEVDNYHILCKVLSGFLSKNTYCINRRLQKLTSREIICPISSPFPERSWNCGISNPKFCPFQSLSVVIKCKKCLLLVKKQSLD